MKKFDFRRHGPLALFGVLTAGMVVFIWLNSCLSGEVSGAQSGRVTAWLLSILDPQGKMDVDAFHYFVRKSAHFLGFAVLGVLVGGLFGRMEALTQRRFRSLPVLMVLLVAVLDEYIQFFSGRGSMVTDVVLDFSGGLTGFAAVEIFVFLRRKIKK